MTQFGLPVLSFVCTALIALLLPIHLRHFNVANASITIWLLACNIIHGVNSIVWSADTEIHIPFWCDIVTKLLLGANVALPGACVYLASHLELLASRRPIRADAPSRRLRNVIASALFLVLPLLYVALHALVQHRRFEIVEDYGCQAAVYPSILTIILIWLPPLFLCTITIVYLGLVLYHTMAISRLSSFADHLENRSPLNMSRFARSAAVCTLFAVFVASLSVISISSAVAAGLSPWNSFGEVHSNYFDIVIISSLDFRSQAHLRATISWGWWMIPILSFVFFGLSACSRGSAKDYRAFGKWVWRKVSGKRDSDAKAHQSSLIPMQNKISVAIVSSSPDDPVDLRSGWDDTLDFKRSKVKSKAKGAQPPLSPSTEESSFTASTVTCVESGTAYTLGLAGSSKAQFEPSPDMGSILRYSWPDPPGMVLSPVSPDSASRPTSLGNPHAPHGHPNIPSIRVARSSSSEDAHGSATAGIVDFPPLLQAVPKKTKPSSSGILRGLNREGYKPSDVIYVTEFTEKLPV